MKKSELIIADNLLHITNSLCHDRDINYDNNKAIITTTFNLHASDLQEFFKRVNTRTEKQTMLYTLSSNSLYTHLLVHKLSNDQTDLYLIHKRGVCSAKFTLVNELLMQNVIMLKINSRGHPMQLDISSANRQIQHLINTSNITFTPCTDYGITAFPTADKRFIYTRPNAPTLIELRLIPNSRYKPLIEQPIVYLLETQSGRLRYEEKLIANHLDEWYEDKHVDLSEYQLAHYLANCNKDITFIPAGSISFVNTAMSLMGIKKPKPIDYPIQLNDTDMGRPRPIEMRLREINADDLPLFIKPSTKLKLFSGFKCYDLYDYRIADISRNTMVWTCKPINIVNEYRFYIIDGKIASHETIREPVHVDMDMVRNMVAKIPHNHYALDIGVTDIGETVFIECNDGYSIGLYGNDVETYIKLITKRWLELLTTAINED